MACNCQSIDCTQSTIGSVVYCTCTTILPNITCPDGYELEILGNGNAVCVGIESTAPIKTPISFDDINYFTPVHWTISYSPIMGRWTSYFSFTPDYYVNHQNHFQTGNNYGVDKEKIWSHSLGNSSFQVFNGRLEPFIVEYVNPNQGAKKLLESISLEVESRRWQNEYDYSVKKGIGFNEAIIYNSTNNSGVLNLFEQKNLNDVRSYPKTNADNSQDILYSSLDGNHTFNYFFNRVINQENNIPIWIWDESMIKKNVNAAAVSFKGKRLLERMKGSHFFTRLTNNSESRYQISLNKAENKEIVE